MQSAREIAETKLLFFLGEEEGLFWSSRGLRDGIFSFFFEWEKVREREKKRTSESIRKKHRFRWRRHRRRREEKKRRKSKRGRGASFFSKARLSSTSCLALYSRGQRGRPLKRRRREKEKKQHREPFRFVSFFFVPIKKQSTMPPKGRKADNLQQKSPAEFFAENKNIAGFDNVRWCFAFFV